MGIRIDDVVPLDQNEIADWRRSKPEGATRTVGPAFQRPGGLADPEEATSPLTANDRYDGSNVSVALDPLPKGRLEPRAAVEEYCRRVMTWAKSNRQFFAARARVLRQASPLQFSHLTDDQLADQLYSMVIEKAKAGVERTYAENGWLKPKDFDIHYGDAPANGGALLLPGQKGRGR